MLAFVSEHRVRGVPVGILCLLFSMCLWIVIGYVDWMNDEHPSGVLPRLVAEGIAPEAQAPETRPRRLVVVLFDGLRADHSRRMASLNQLARSGSELNIDMGFPTYSRPGYAVFSSGVPGDRSGIRTNAYVGRARVDSIWDRARDAGLGVDAVSNLDWWRELFPRAFDHCVVTTQDTFDETAEVLLEADNDLLLLHSSEVDIAGHEGGARSREYALAVRHMDTLLAHWLTTIDLERDAILILSDHGHLYRGGHGGDESEVRFVRGVAAGFGFKSGEVVDVEASQIAPTISVLMGLRFPVDAEGVPAFEVMDGSALGVSYVEKRRREWEDHTIGYLTALAAKGPSDFLASDGFFGWRAGMLELRQDHRVLRVSLAALGISLGFFLILTLRRESWIKLVLVGLSFSAVYLVAAFLTHHATSLSIVERAHRYMLRLLSLSLIAFLGQLMAMRTLRIRDWDTVFMIGAWTTLSTVLLTLAYYGIPLSPPLPPPALMYWPLGGTFMAASQAGLGAVALMLAALGEVWRNRAFRKHRDSQRRRREAA